MTDATVIHLDDLPRLRFTAPDEPDWIPVRGPLQLGAFGLNAFVARGPGEVLIEPHDESGEGHEEVYVLLEGTATMTVGDAEHTLRPGSIVALRDPAVHRTAVAGQQGARMLAIGGPRGEAFAPTAWEQRELERHGVLDAEGRPVDPV
jgi:uncharacterized cupin superfamily protein